MQAHDHASSGHGGHGGHDAHGGHAAHAAAKDPDFDWWLGSTLLFLAVLTGVFVLPATHAAAPATPVRPLAPEPGHADTLGHRVAEVEASRGAAHASAEQGDDRQRLAKLYGALAGGGAADDSVSPEVNAEIAWLIKHVAESGLTFTRDGEEQDAVDTANYMLERWEKSVEPVYSVESLIRKVAGYKLVDQKLNRVRFHGGSERPLNVWLQEEITAYRKGQ